MISLASTVDAVAGHTPGWVAFQGNKNIAMSVGALISILLWAKTQKLGSNELWEAVAKPMEVSGIIILITSAGGAFGAMIKHSGIGQAISVATEGFSINYVLLGWMIGEKFDKRRVAAGCMLMHAAGLLMLTYATGLVILVLAALVHGTAWGLRGPFMQAIRADYFGRRSIGMILGLSSLIIVIGQIGGPMVAGMLADLTGNYRAGFTVLALLAGLGSLFFLLAKRPA